MEIIRIEQLGFTYSGAGEQALRNIHLHVEAGEIVTLCGASGSGKSTLLRHLKSVLAPYGERTGDIFYHGKLLENVPEEAQVKSIGFVSQSADNQLVTDKVYHELAFGLESLGYDNDTIRRRVGEMATFFGITDWFYQDVDVLSGGQKQILCLASIMTMLPEVIILDEPTSQLDTIAAGEFINMLLKINRELGVTILITEHRLDEILPYSDRVVVMDKGEIIADDTPEQVCVRLKNIGHTMFLSMPVPVRIWNGCEESGTQCPLTVNEGRRWLTEYVERRRTMWNIEPPAKKKSALSTEISSGRDEGLKHETETILSAKELWFKYGKNEKDILRGVSLKIQKGEIYGLLGGNGAGKSTLLSVLCGIRKAYRGKIQCTGKICMLPQEPKNLFVKKTMEQELNEVLCCGSTAGTHGTQKDKEAEQRKESVIRLCRLETLRDRNPYDLSGGEQQRAALAKVLLTEPDILLLDEPTKGLDNEYKEVLGHLLRRLAEQGKTIIMVSHDIEFCAAWTDRCGLFFDGGIISQAECRRFFAENSFYTTATNRMARTIMSDAIVPQDIIDTFGRNGRGKTYRDSDDNDGDNDRRDNDETGKVGISEDRNGDNRKNHQNNGSKSYWNKRMLLTAVMVIVAIPFTIYAGIHYFDDRKYLFISLLVLLECIAPFFMIYEGKNPSARDLMTISVLCAICVAGRMAFYMLPQFKPVMAIVILSGVTLGAEAGFLVGAVTMLVSNILFGQGPWTPWQMFAMGLVGFIAGLLFYKKIRGEVGIITKLMLSGYGMVAAVVLYGGIMNPSAAIMAHARLNKATLISYYAAGFPMDLIQGAATVVFLFLLTKPVVKKIERIKVKYGIRG